MKQPLGHPSTLLRPLLALAALAATVGPAFAGEVFVKPHAGTGFVNSTSWVTPDGSDSDTYSWDEFTLPLAQTITEVRWRGGYALNGVYGKALSFRVSFFASNASGFEPLITALPEKEEQETVIASFHTPGNAGETYIGSFGGQGMYDYRFVLPEPVTIPAGEKCWLRVVAEQPVYPDWGQATGVGGNGAHFRYSTGSHMFQNWPHDLAFALHARWVGLGHGLAGTAGTPTLTGQGVLAGGQTATVDLDAGRPLAFGWLVAGTSELDLAIAGGVLVPDPLLLLPFQCDAAGHAAFPLGLTPGTPSGIPIVLQAWLLDPLGPEGFAASDGLSTLTE